MKKIAVIGGGPFGIISALRLSQFPENQVVLFESQDRLGGLASSEYYKGQYLDYNTKVIPCNAFGKPGLNPVLEHFLSGTDALLDEIGDFYFLKDGQYVDVPPPLLPFSKIRVLREAGNVLKHFSKVEDYSNVFDLIAKTQFEPHEGFQQMGERLSIQSFTRMTAYLGNIFGMNTEGAEAASIVTSRNSFVTYNYLNSIFQKSRLTQSLQKWIDRDDLLNRTTAIPHRFFILTTGYDRFLQSLLQPKDNLEILLKHSVTDIISQHSSALPKYVVKVEGAGDQYADFDEVVLALPKTQVKRMRHPLVAERVKALDETLSCHVLTSFNLVNSLKYLPKGVYLDQNNPHHIGLPNLVRDGAVYGTFKHFSADPMFEMLAMIDDIDSELVDESFVHAKAFRAFKEMGFDIEANEIKPYSWKLTKWTSPFMTKGQFSLYEKIQRNQGEAGLWFGGEMMSGPGVPTIIKYIEDLFGPFELS